MLNVITLFSGYDSQCLALNRLGIPYDLVAWCEIDKHACVAHDALFPQFAGRNLGDITKVDWAEVKTMLDCPIDLLASPIPRTQHAKLAGNSIVVACLYYIFRNLFISTEPEAGTQTRLF